MRLNQKARYQENVASFSHQFFFGIILIIKILLCLRHTFQFLFIPALSLNGLKFVLCIIRSSLSKTCLQKGALKIWSNFTGKHPRGKKISIKLLCNFIKMTLPHGCSPVNLLHIFRTPFNKNTSGGMLLHNFRVPHHHILKILTHFWLMFPFCSPGNNRKRVFPRVFRGYKIGTLPRNMLNRIFTKISQESVLLLE